LKNAVVGTEREQINCERLKIVAIDKIEPDDGKKQKGNAKGKKKERKPKKK